ncbi:MAG: DUF308 domain-containing protein [Oscillospiraceae bacterium]|nr:DUF308 domain-containing protein [Oscillospiraceae bacterium]
MRFVGKVKAFGVAASVGMFLAGLGLLLYPQASAETVCCVFGVLFLVMGVIRIFGYFSKDLYRLAFQFDLAAGSFLILAGAIFLIFPSRIYLILPVIAGIFILIDSLLRIQTALDARSFGVRRWWCILIFGACAAALGVLLILHPFEGADMMVRLLGVTLMINALQNIYIIISTVRVIRAAGGGAACTGRSKD